jgi:predicted nucleic acid-binding protein
VIILDANVLIGFLDADDAHHNSSLDLIERRFADGFATSVLTIAEALVAPTRVNLADRAQASLRKIGVRMIPIESGDAAALARTRTDYRLRMPDAVALFTALSTGSELATFDTALAAACERAGVGLAG